MKKGRCRAASFFYEVMMNKAILFDMVGVLVLSEALTAKAGVAAMQEFGITCKESDFLQFVGTGEAGYMGGVAELYGKSYVPEMTEKLYAAYGALIGAEQKPKNLDAVLTALKSRGYLLAVCSSANALKVGYNLQAIGYGTDFFDAVITGSDVTKNKPEPDVFLLGAERMGALPEKCIVIEDAVNGVKAAHAGGMPAVAVCSTLDKQTLLTQAQPDYIVDTLEAILDIL